MHRSAALEALGIPMSLIVARGLSPFAEAKDLEVAEVGEEARQHLLIPEASHRVALHEVRRARGRYLALDRFGLP